jgi:hypothetical protein
VVFPAKERPRIRFGLSQIAFFDDAGGFTKRTLEGLGKGLNVEIAIAYCGFENIMAEHQLLPGLQQPHTFLILIGRNAKRVFENPQEVVFGNPDLK